MNHKRAFETVDREKLIEKLYQYGIKMALEWLKSYLNNKTQQVRFNDKQSKLIAILNIDCHNLYWDLCYLLYI